MSFWTVANDNVPDWQQFPKWVMFHCLSVFITSFTTNLVLWCSVQLVLLWKQLSSVLQWRFPFGLHRACCGSAWCDDGSCKVPRWATVGPDVPHIGFLLTDSFAILMLFLTVQLKGHWKEVVPWKDMFYGDWRPSPLYALQSCCL